MLPYYEQLKLVESRNKKRRLMNGQMLNQQQQLAVLEKQNITRSMRERQSEAQQQALQQQSMGRFEVQDQQEAQRQSQERVLRKSQERSHHSPIAPGGAPPIQQPVSSSSELRSPGQQMPRQHDAAVAFQSQPTVNWVDVNNAPANASLTQAQKHQLYSEQLLRLEEQNHERLRRKREHEQQQRSQEHALRRQQFVQQQRAAQQAVNDLESDTRANGSVDIGRFQDPNGRSSPSTIQSMLHSPQLRPDQSRSSTSLSKGFLNPLLKDSLASQPDSATASPRQRSTLDLARLQRQESSASVPSWRNHLPNPSFGQETATSSPPSPSDRLLPTSTPQGYPWGQRQSSSGNGDTAPNMFTFGSASSDDYYDKLELELHDSAHAREKVPSFFGTPFSGSSWLEDPRPVDSSNKSPGPIFSARGPYYQ